MSRSSWETSYGPATFLITRITRRGTKLAARLLKFLAVALSACDQVQVVGVWVTLWKNSSTIQFYGEYMHTIQMLHFVTEHCENLSHLVHYGLPESHFLNTSVQTGRRKDILVTVLRLRLHLRLLFAPLGTSTWWSNSLIMLACHVSTKDEATLTSSSECSHCRLPHCALNNVLYLIIESSTFILFLITQAQVLTPHLGLCLYCCLHVAARLHLEWGYWSLLVRLTAESSTLVHSTAKSHTTQKLALTTYDTNCISIV